MKYEDLPTRWKTKIIEYLRSQGETERTQLTTFDFYSNLIVQTKFDDGSFAEFRYPLVINAPEFDELGIFTKRCGHHIFNLSSTYVNVISELYT